MVHITTHTVRGDDLRHVNEEIFGGLRALSDSDLWFVVVGCAARRVIDHHSLDPPTVPADPPAARTRIRIGIPIGARSMCAM